LRTYLFSGFPWTLLADSQVHHLAVIQIASVTGVYGVSFLVALVNVSLAEAMGAAVNANGGQQERRLTGKSAMGSFLKKLPFAASLVSRLSRLPPLTLTVVLVGFSFLFGFYRLHTLPHSFAPSTRVALLQGNIDQYKKWDKAYVNDIEIQYAALAIEASKSKPAMIIWPETSVPGFLLQDQALRKWLLDVVQISGTSHLIGAPVLNRKNAYNSSFSINHEGVLEGEYAKHHLVPFGEVVPWASVLSRWIHVLNDLGGFTAGRGSSVVSVAGVPVGVNICYEAIFPNLVRQSIRQGGQLIANLTNDGWYMQTAAPYQHWAPNIFRAVENGRWLLRADNTGISGIIDPVGKVVAQSSIFETTVVSGLVQPRTELTVYTRFGDVFAWICCFISLLAIAI
jgi:apolipoprotein N-acyltransferase